MVSIEATTIEAMTSQKIKGKQKGWRWLTR